MKRYTLSLTLIVKNEEKHLARVLHNAHYYADEIVIVDTGSTDRTKEIARQLTPTIHGKMILLQRVTLA